ncbi:MAG: HRDC domain-containing protein [Candidatus Nanopelagicus sp.]
MLTPLLSPRAGTPEISADESSFEKVIEDLLAGNGPIAIDAERASGYRYSQKAYLIQIFRKNGGLHLIDPIGLQGSKLWQKFNQSFSEIEWVIHASTQDLPCLIEVGLMPKKLFDTELGARIAGCPKVSLGALSESLLELQLAKEHSAVDWSIRPLRPEWINYAALDVDILLEIRDKVEQMLIEQNKLKWAVQDFESILRGYQDFKFSDMPKPDRWRKTSGMHKVRDRLTMTIVKQLWLSRDQLAQELDLAPGRVLNDEAIIELAIKRPESLEEVAKVIGWRTRLESPPFNRWLKVLNLALATPIEQQVQLRVESLSLPPLRVWKEKNPIGYARLTHVRAALAELSTQLQIPTENLITPEFIKRICWQQPPSSESEYESFVVAKLQRLGARSWQVEQVSKLVASKLGESEPLIIPEPVESESQSAEENNS